MIIRDRLALLKNPIFSCLWLAQETSVARNTTLHCGQAAIHYTDLVDVFRIFILLIKILLESRNDISFFVGIRKLIRSYLESHVSRF
jgi:hypothetical protein